MKAPPFYGAGSGGESLEDLRRLPPEVRLDRIIDLLALALSRRVGKALGDGGAAQGQPRAKEPQQGGSHGD